MKWQDYLSPSLKMIPQLHKQHTRSAVWCPQSPKPKPARCTVTNLSQALRVARAGKTLLPFPEVPTEQKSQ